MQLSDLLDLFKGNLGGGSAPDPAAQLGAPAVAGAPGGVAAMLNGGPAAPGTPTPPQAAPAPAATPPAPAIPAPSTPPSTDQGLGGFLSSLVHKATTRDPNTGMSFMDKVGQLGANMSDTAGMTSGAEAQGQTEAATRVAQTRRAQIMQMAKSLNMTPREQLIFAADPEAWTKANATGLETRTVGGGDSTLNGATGQVTTAPKIGQEKGEGFLVGSDGMTDLGGLKPSPQQTAEDEVKQAQQQAMEFYHQLMAKAALQRSAAEQTRANKPALGNGAGRARSYGQDDVHW